MGGGERGSRLAASVEPAGASRRRHLGFFRGAMGSHPGVLMWNWILSSGSQAPSERGGSGEGRALPAWDIFPHSKGTPVSSQSS